MESRFARYKAKKPSACITILNCIKAWFSIRRMAAGIKPLLLASYSRKHNEWYGVNLQTYGDLMEDPARHSAGMGLLFLLSRWTVATSTLYGVLLRQF